LPLGGQTRPGRSRQNAEYAHVIEIDLADIKETDQHGKGKQPKKQVSIKFNRATPTVGHVHRNTQRSHDEDF